VVVDDRQMERRSAELIGRLDVEVATEYQRPQPGNIAAFGSLQKFLLPGARLPAVNIYTDNAT
jgi:hypothetical protein